VLKRFAYPRLKRADKGLVPRYLGRSRQQLTRLVRQCLATGGLAKRYPAQGFARKYTGADVALLAETDALHDTLSGPATKHLMQRALWVFWDTRYARLAFISVAHLYNLRAAAGYRARRQHWAKTRRTGIPIGERRAPQPDGHPGYLRIDSVHQGDEDGGKGVYHINVVDCVTQWEVVATCERLSEAYLLPVIKALLDNFPFAIRGFHADNGSEYINHRVARLLEKLRIEFTKSRPRHSNDNGLAETKNGAVVRKCFGYGHIPQRYAMQINAFCAASLNPTSTSTGPACSPSTPLMPRASPTPVGRPTPPTPTTVTVAVTEFDPSSQQLMRRRTSFFPGDGTMHVMVEEVTGGSLKVVSDYKIPAIVEVSELGTAAQERQYCKKRSPLLARYWTSWGPCLVRLRTAASASATPE
jgi:transposase InsO family protein